MEVIYLVNKVSATSVPLQWAKFLESSSFNQISVKVYSIYELFLNYRRIRRNADIVHGHHVKIMLIYLLLSPFLKKKTVFTVHGSFQFLSKFNASLLRLVFLRTERIIFVNRELYEILPSYLKEIINSKYEIILNGIDLNYSYRNIDVYKKYNIRVSEGIIFHPARFVREKNHIRLLQAIAKLGKADVAVSLVLAGDGLLRPEIERTIKRLGIEDNVYVLGLIDRDEVYSFLQRCDVFVMPSVSEGLNIAFLEALSMVCRVLVSDIEQFSYPVSLLNGSPKDNNVEMVNPLDVNSIALGIKELLGRDINPIGDCSILSLDRMMQQYVSLYYELIQ